VILSCRCSFLSLAISGSARSAVSKGDQIAGNALFNVSHAPFHLGGGEVLVAVVDRFELAAVDGNHGIREQLKLATEGDELLADVTNRGAVVTPEVGDGLEVGAQTMGDPHQLDIALDFALQTAAGLDAVEIAVDVVLEQHRWMVCRPAGDRRGRAFKAQCT
jgi:hypothetical protein